MNHNISPDREPMLKDLNPGMYRITFTKVDGTARTLIGTLMAEYLPPLAESEQKEKKPIAKSESAIRVWDMEKRDWRGYRIDSVQNWEQIELPLPVPNA